jgi:dephospho-CoA kinase
VRVWGLTGNIGAGKSTVARLLAARGVPVVDADQIAREVVLPGRPALREIAARWPSVISADGTLDRRALAALVFADPAERAELNRIIHPRIAEQVSARLDALAGAGQPVAVYEAALIVENGLHAGLDGLIVVTAPEEAQASRLLRRDGMTPAEVRARMSAQLPAAEKLRHATVAIDNAGDEASLAAQVDRLVAAMGQGRGR